MNYLDLKKAKKCYLEGGNIMEFLKKEYKDLGNTSRIIEIAYELQAGSYIELTNKNRKRFDLYTMELSKFLKPHLKENSSLLDVGTGELTVLSLLLNHLPINNLDIYAFDISWSRLFKGEKFFKKNYEKKNNTLKWFVADMKNIPLHSKSIDVVMSNHSLEPNGHNLQSLLKEILRVAKHKCILFEPSYELNSLEGKARMDKLGYIKDIEGNVNRLGGKVLDITLIKNSSNPTNPGACYVIEPPKSHVRYLEKKSRFTVPGTDLILEKEDNYYSSPDTGLFYPILKNIPILKDDKGILGSAFFEQ